MTCRLVIAQRRRWWGGQVVDWSCSCGFVGESDVSRARAMRGFEVHRRWVIIYEFFSR